MRKNTMRPGRRPTFTKRDCEDTLSIDLPTGGNGPAITDTNLTEDKQSMSDSDESSIKMSVEEPKPAPEKQKTKKKSKN